MPDPIGRLSSAEDEPCSSAAGGSGWTFLAPALYVTAQSAWTLSTRGPPREGPAGIALVGWWRVDPAAALLAIPWLVREGLEGVRGEDCC